MQLYGKRGVIILTFIFMIAWQFLPAQKRYPRSLQTAEILNLKIDPDSRKSGLSGIKVDFDCGFRYEEAEMISDVDISYDFSLYLTDTIGTELKVLSDAIAFRNNRGSCRDSFHLRMEDNTSRYNKLGFFIPHFAPALDSGLQTIQIHLRIRDPLLDKFVIDKNLGSISFRKPPVRLFRLSILSFTVPERNKEGETWDISILNPKDVQPDLRWLLRRGGKQVYESGRIKNSYVYEGTSKDRSPLLSLSEDDSLSFQVIDYDLLGASDLIGRLEFNPWQDGFILNSVQSIAFQKVEECNFKLEGFPSPRLSLQNLNLRFPARYKGSTGAIVSFDYRIRDEQLNAQYSMDVRLKLDRWNRKPGFMKVAGGPAGIDEEGRLIFLRGNGNLELFIPHYGLSEGNKIKATELTFSTQVRVADQFYPAGEAKLSLSNTYPEVNDLLFRDIQAGSGRVKGVNGLWISCRFVLPADYHEDLPEARFRIKPGFSTEEGPIPFEYLDLIQPKNLNLKNGEFYIPQNVDSARMYFFVPWYKLAPVKNSLQVKAYFAARMERGITELLIGEQKTDTTLILPKLKAAELGIRNFKLKKKKWMEPGPNLRWEIWQGRKKMYESPVVYRDPSPEWVAQDKALLLLSPSDSIRIVVHHLSRGGYEHRMAEWEGMVDQLPWGEKGLPPLKMKGIRRLRLDLQYKE